MSHSPGFDALVRDELIEGLLENADGATIFISSHDLTELESFASHIGYLERGRLQFSEEMNSLIRRFRTIEITFEKSSIPVGPWPANWWNAEQSSNLIRFVDTQFEKERTMDAIQLMFGTASQVAVHPMPLREIFVTLAKAGRKAA
jgi:ABC-2 type transport system ATP-binding protein